MTPETGGVRKQDAQAPVLFLGQLKHIQGYKIACGRPVAEDFSLVDIYAAVGLIASGATITTVLVSAIKYFQQKKAESTRASKNLYLELEDTLVSLDGKRFPDDFYSKIMKDQKGIEKTIYFMARTFNHDFYDSLIYSGKINFLDPDLQQRVQNIFKRIKTHNKYVDAVFEMSELNYDDVPLKALKYCEWMDDAEKHLQQELPALLQSLQVHFKHRP